MGMNIKNEEAHRLAQELSLMTGESLTTAVTEAIRERLSRLRGRTALPMSERLRKIGEECAPRLAHVSDHATLLYGDDGLPL